MSYQYCGLDDLQWAHRAFVVLFIMLPDVPVKNQNRVDTNNILLGTSSSDKFGSLGSNWGFKLRRLQAESTTHRL